MSWFAMTFHIIHAKSQNALLNSCSVRFFSVIVNVCVAEAVFTRAGSYHSKFIEMECSVYTIRIYTVLGIYLHVQYVHFSCLIFFSSLVFARDATCRIPFCWRSTTNVSAQTTNWRERKQQTGKKRQKQKAPPDSIRHRNRYCCLYVSISAPPPIHDRPRKCRTFVARCFAI